MTGRSFGSRSRAKSEGRELTLLSAHDPINHLLELVIGDPGELEGVGSFLVPELPLNGGDIAGAPSTSCSVSASAPQTQRE